jgi:hypothetical protein
MSSDQPAAAADERRGGAPPRSRVTRYDPISIWEIDMGDRYGRSDINEIDIDSYIDMGYALSIWDMVYRYGYRYGIWYIDMIIYHI